MTDDEKRDLAEAIRTWRSPGPLSAAARVLGIPLRTLQGIEQGRGFSYPTLLLHALKTMERPNGNAS